MKFLKYVSYSIEYLCSPVLPFLPRVTLCYRLLPHVTPCYPCYPMLLLLPHVTPLPHVTHCYPCYCMLPLVTPCFP